MILISLFYWFCKKLAMAKIYLSAVFIVCTRFCWSQIPPGNLRDTLVVTIQQAEDSFLVNNLALIAQQYSIDSAKATVITARLWDNPEFDYTNGFYNFQTHHFFEPEINMQVSQLVR